MSAAHPPHAACAVHSAVEPCPGLLCDGARSWCVRDPVAASTRFVSVGSDAAHARAVTCENRDLATHLDLVPRAYEKK